MCRDAATTTLNSMALGIVDLQKCLNFSSSITGCRNPPSAKDGTTSNSKYLQGFVNRSQALLPLPGRLRALSPLQGMAGEDLKSYIVQGFQDDLREDGRSCRELRPVTLSVSGLQQCSGSARCSIGSTQVLVGIKVMLTISSVLQMPTCLVIHLTNIYNIQIVP